MANETWPAHNIAAAVVASMKAHERKPSDFYPTPPAATVALVKELATGPRRVLRPAELIAEPACGEGDMVMTLAAMGYPCIATDLNDTGFGGRHIDFLDPANDWRWDDVRVMMTNPPFAVADRFIRRAVPRFEVVALLLKSNFWHSRNRLERLWDSFPPTRELKVTWRLAFLEAERGKSPLMDCTWFIWVRGEKPLDRPLPRPSAAFVPDVSQKPLLVHLRRAAMARDRLSAVIHGG